MGFLIPENPHPSLDNAAKKVENQTSAVRGAVRAQCDAWRVSVFEMEALNQVTFCLGVMRCFLMTLEGLD